MSFWLIKVGCYFAISLRTLSEIIVNSYFEMKLSKQILVLGLLFIPSSLLMAKAPTSVNGVQREFVKYKCELAIDSARRNNRHDHNLIEEVYLPVSKTPFEQTPIFLSEEVNKTFGSANLSHQFLANLTKDPITKKNKLFIGMYLVRGLNEVRRSSKDPSLFSIPIVTYYSSQKLMSNVLALPIMSGVSDSGKVELFTGRYGQEIKTKFSCEESSASPSDSTNSISGFDSDIISGREKFQCNVIVKSKSTGLKLEEYNKVVYLGYSKRKRDLQPIIEDESLRKFFIGIDIMGNLFFNEETQKTEFVLGAYSVRKGYDPLKHSEYWTPPQYNYSFGDGSHRPYFYSTPEFEVTTNSDYAEIRSLSALSYIYETSVGCKKISNKTSYLSEN